MMFQKEQAQYKFDHKQILLCLFPLGYYLLACLLRIQEYVLITHMDGFICFLMKD